MNEMINILMALVAASLTPTAIQAAPSTAFTYQGQLKSGGAPFTGPAAFEFTLWDAEFDGRPVAEPVRLELEVVSGLFTAPLDFGLEAFRGEPTWLQISVRANRDSVVLTPRQPITPAPFALYALNAPTGGGTGLTLPYAGSTTSTDVGFGVAQSGLGSSGAFSIDNADNPRPALVLATLGSGPGLMSTSYSGPAVWGRTGVGGGNAGYFETLGTDNTQPALAAENKAGGPAAYFRTTKSDNTNPVLVVETQSDGSAARFFTTLDPNNANLEPTLTSTNDSFGSAGEFVVTHPDNTSDALIGQTIGSGDAVVGFTSGSGRAGVFEVDNISVRTRPALQATTNARGGSAGLFRTTNGLNGSAALIGEANGNNTAVLGIAQGLGDAVVGHTAFGGDAVVGLVEGRSGNAGSFSILEPTNAEPALMATTTGSGPAIKATTAGTGAAARFESTGAAQALDVSGNGVLKEALRAVNVNRDRGIAAFFRNDSSEPAMIIVNGGFGPIIELANSTAQVVAQIGQAGQVWASRFEFSRPKTHTMSFSPVDFRDGYVDVNRGTRFICVDAGLESTHRVYATVHLPDGATITSVSFAAFDGNSAHGLTLVLGRTSLRGDAAVGLARLDTTGSSGATRIATNSILYETVDNNNYAYYLSVVSTSITCESKCCWPLELAVLGATITYTTSEAD